MGRLKLRKPKGNNPIKNKLVNQRISDQNRRIIAESIKNDIYENCKSEVSDVCSTWLLASFVLALHREFGFGQQRLMKALNAVDKVAGELDGIEMDKVVAIVEDEVNIRIVGGYLKEDL